MSSSPDSGLFSFCFLITENGRLHVHTGAQTGTNPPATLTTIFWFSKFLPAMFQMLTPIHFTSFFRQIQFSFGKMCTMNVTIVIAGIFCQ